MLHDSSDEDEGGGGGISQKPVKIFLKINKTKKKKFSFFLYQVSTNRPGAPLNRSVGNHHTPHVNIVSPLLTTKAEHSSHPSKPSPSHYSSPQNNFYASPTPTQRTLPKIPTNSNNNSPSLSIHSSTNTTVSPETIHQSSTVIHNDSTSIKSDDSSNFFEGHLHPSQQQQQQQQSSIRNQDNKTRSQQQNISIHNTNNLTKPLTNTTSSSTGTTASSTGIPIDRVPSPSPSLISEREREENERVERELELKRKRLQIYVFVCRCVACPFNSKQSSDMARKHLKITLVQYGVIKERFLAFLNGKTHIEADEGN